jgi:GMP synthase (glutamine-hydrolysing) A subunit
MTAQTTSLEKIIVLDFGSQYNQLITRRIREFGVFSELLHNDITAEEIKAHGNVKGIIFSGGPHSVYAEDAFTVDPAIFELGIPVLGICYGMQLTTHLFGGKVESSTTREYGSAKVDVFNTTSGIFKGLAEEEEVLMSHGDRITAIPEGFSVTASNAHTPFAAFENQERRIYGVQFHPEVRHSIHGNDMLRNFVFDICGATGDWSMDSFIEMEIAKIREKVGNKKVLLGLSGGVDSSVVGVLLQKAIGDQLIYIHDIKLEAFLVPGHTWGHLVYLIDDAYLFTGDTIWFGADGGYAFLNTLAEDRKLQSVSLKRLEEKLKKRNLSLKIITGHTGWTDDFEFAFRHVDEICNALKRKPKVQNPKAPYDGFDESDDTEEKARTVILEKC